MSMEVIADSVSLSVVQQDVVISEAMIFRHVVYRASLQVQERGINLSLINNFFLHVNELGGRAVIRSASSSNTVEAFKSSCKCVYTAIIQYIDYHS